VAEQARPHDERLQAKAPLFRSHPMRISSFFPEQMVQTPSLSMAGKVMLTPSAGLRSHWLLFGSSLALYSLIPKKKAASKL
jgi:hypothetical protein